MIAQPPAGAGGLGADPARFHSQPAPALLGPAPADGPHLGRHVRAPRSPAFSTLWGGSTTRSTTTTASAPGGASATGSGSACSSRSSVYGVLMQAGVREFVRQTGILRIFTWQIVHP